MSRKWEEQTAAFTVVDEDGNERELYVFTHFHEAWDGSKNIPVRGRKRVQTADGTHVNGVEGSPNQFYLINEPDKILTADDPPDQTYGSA